VPGELTRELEERVAANADAVEKVPIILLVDMNQKAVLEIRPAGETTEDVPVKEVQE